MTNEEKANEIARCDCQKHYKGFNLCNSYKFHEKNYCSRKAAALEAMEWKDEQFEAEKQALIDKACEWLEQHLYDDEYIIRDNEGTWVDAYFLSKGFKQAMKGE